MSERYIKVVDCSFGCIGKPRRFKDAAGVMRLCPRCLGSGAMPKPGAEPFSGIEGQVMTSRPMGGKYEITLHSDEPADTLMMHGTVLLAGIGGGD